MARRPLTDAEKGRRTWEKSPEGQARTQGAQEILGTTASLRQIYFHAGWGRTDPREAGPGQQSFAEVTNDPGFRADPKLTAATPPRWEDIEPKKQAKIETSLREKLGTDIAKMSTDFGAQLDQSYIRAAGHGTSPHSEHFYSHGEPAQVVRQSAHHLGIPFSHHMAMNALTSPNTTFHNPKNDTYPNNNAAMAAVEIGRREGPIPLPLAQDDVPRTGHGVRQQGYRTNIRKAASAFRQLVNGTPISELRGEPTKSTPGGTAMLGPKTGPYHNSFSERQPHDEQYFVSDVHSGGRGMLPHLGSEKAVKLDDAGAPKLSKTGKTYRSKSEQEKGIETAGWHSAADFAARKAIEVRGLTSVRQAQAAQWGEAQLQARTSDNRPLVSESSVYPKRVVDKKQGTMFEQHKGDEVVSEKAMPHTAYHVEQEALGKKRKQEADDWLDS